eukprot:366419-Chlamydomonas_euryale.AAC.3
MLVALHCERACMCTACLRTTGIRQRACVGANPFHEELPGLPGILQHMSRVPAVTTPLPRPCHARHPLACSHATGKKSI